MYTHYPVEPIGTAYTFSQPSPWDQNVLTCQSFWKFLTGTLIFKAFTILASWFLRWVSIRNCVPANAGQLIKRPLMSGRVECAPFSRRRLQGKRERRRGWEEEREGLWWTVLLHYDQYRELHTPLNIYRINKCHNKGVCTTHINVQSYHVCSKCKLTNDVNHLNWAHDITKQANLRDDAGVSLWGSQFQRWGITRVLFIDVEEVTIVLLSWRGWAGTRGGTSPAELEEPSGMEEHV